MTRFTLLAALAATLTLGSFAFAGPGHEYQRSRHARVQRDVERPHAVLGEIQQATEYRWELQRPFKPRPSLHRVRYVRMPVAQQ